MHAALDWALCRSFLAVLREGSFLRAALALGVTHPTVRRHINDLEAIVGSPLFIRSPSGLFATELANEVRAAAEAMESAAEHFVRIATKGPGDISGTVRITASDVMGVEVLPTILQRLRKAHPNLHFELAVTNLVDNLLRHDAEIAVRMARPAQDDLIARKIGDTELGLFAHQAWLSRHGWPDSLQAVIASGSMIGYDRNTAILKALADKGFQVTRKDFAVRSDNDLAQLAALRAGLGVGICQCRLAARDPLLQRILPEFSHVLEIWIVMHASLRASESVRVTADALKRGLAEFLDNRLWGAEPPR